MKNKTWYYIHTIGNGIPAYYEKGRQIIYANGVMGGGGIRGIAESLEQIKAEQKLSKKWRKKQGWKSNNDYGYVRILRSLF
jgi:hypothetical protein